MGHPVYRSIKPHLQCILGVTFNETLTMAAGGRVETTIVLVGLLVMSFSLL